MPQYPNNQNFPVIALSPGETLAEKTKVTIDGEVKVLNFGLAEGLAAHGSRIWRFPVLLVAALSLACAKPVSIRDEVSVYFAWLKPGMKVEIFSDGKPVAFTVNSDSSNSPELDFTVNSELQGKNHRFPVLKIRVLDACGWQESALKLDQEPDIDSIRRAAEIGEPMYYRAPMPERPYHASTFWLDNRGGPAGVLKIGQVETPVKAGELARIEVTGCPAPVPISFAGATLGELPTAAAEDALTSASPWAIADPSGRRCYQEFRVFYGRREDGGGGQSQPSILSGAKLYPRPQFIAYVMEDPPTMKMARDDEDTSAWVLKEAKCP